MKHLIVPDTTVSVEDMHEYHYINDNMLPVSMVAAAYYHKWIPVYVLYNDNTEELVDNRVGYYAEHIYGIDATEWNTFVATDTGIKAYEYRPDFSQEMSRMHKYLPKWPQMRVKGKSILPEQAMEIIRRTDSFFEYPSGNNHKFIEDAVHILKYPDYQTPTDDFEKRMNMHREWTDNWGYIHLNYVSNNWVSCSYIGGPNGWCHPDGTIQYNLNIGKWPTVDQVYSDWCKIAHEFPFLDLVATIMNDEVYSDLDDFAPVVSFIVKDGLVNIVEPIDIDVGKTKAFSKSKIIAHLKDTSFENAFSLEQIQKWADEHLK